MTDQSLDDLESLLQELDTSISTSALFSRGRDLSIFFLKRFFIFGDFPLSHARVLPLFFCSIPRFEKEFSFPDAFASLPDAKPKAAEPAPARPPAPSSVAPVVEQEKPQVPIAQPVADVSTPAPKAVAPATEANKCGRCQKALEETYIQALDKYWHPQCFTCSKCTSPLEGNFYEHETGIICQNCASSMFKCSECGQSISGSHLVFDDGRIVHPTCVQVRIRHYRCF
jgi:hypothetical protein